MLRESSLISTQLFVLNSVEWFGVLSNKLIISWYSIIVLLYCYVNHRSSIVFCPPSGDIYFSLGISLSCSFLTVAELFCGEVFETFVLLPAILLRIISPFMFSIFWIVLFEAVLSASVGNYLAWLRSFWLSLAPKFLLLFLPIF